MNPSLSRDVALVIERVEAAACRDKFASAGPGERTALGLRTRELAGALVVAADRSESLLHNRVLGLGLMEPVTAGVLDAVLGHYPENGPGFAVNLSPFAEPADIERVLAARGFATYFHHLKWVRAPEPVAAVRSALSVRRVEAAEATAWGELAARIFTSDSGSSAAHAAWASRCVGRTGWTHYFASDGELPVGVGMLFVSDGAAWLGSGGTLPSHRRQGAQGALLAQRVRDGLSQGARWLTTETGPDWADLPGESLRNAARAGFHVAYQRPSWIRAVP